MRRQGERRAESATDLCRREIMRSSYTVPVLLPLSAPHCVETTVEAVISPKHTQGTRYSGARSLGVEGEARSSGTPKRRTSREAVGSPHGTAARTRLRSRSPAPLPPWVPHGYRGSRSHNTYCCQRLEPAGGKAGGVLRRQSCDRHTRYPLLGMQEGSFGDNRAIVIHGIHGTHCGTH